MPLLRSLIAPLGLVAINMALLRSFPSRIRRAVPLLDAHGRSRERQFAPNSSWTRHLVAQAFWKEKLAPTDVVGYAESASHGAISSPAQICSTAWRSRTRADFRPLTITSAAIARVL